MKPRVVGGLVAELELVDAAKRIVAVRAAELYAFVPAALDARNTTALHDMRIAAKRLRYVLEIVGFCLPEVAAETGARARELQSVLGDIHDHDVLLARIARMHRGNKKGMRRLALRLRSRRDALFSDFTALWRAIDESDLRGRIIAATSYSPNGTVMRA